MRQNKRTTAIYPVKVPDIYIPEGKLQSQIALFDMRNAASKVRMVLEAEKAERDREYELTRKPRPYIHFLNPVPQPERIISKSLRNDWRNFVFVTC